MAPTPNLSGEAKQKPLISNIFEFFKSRNSHFYGTKHFRKTRLKTYLCFLTEYLCALFKDQKTSQKALSLNSSQPRTEGGAKLT